MTPPRFRRHHRNPDGRRPVLDGDFPGGEPVTEVLGRAELPAWDGTTWGGASGAGLDPDNIYAQPAPVTVRETEPVSVQLAARLRRRPPAPETSPALPPAPAGDQDKIALDMAAGWPHLFEVRCAYPAAACATPIPCGAVHRDAGALSFRALRASAFAAGWHLDALGRLCCPRCCQDSPEYRTLYPVTIWDPGAAAAVLAGDFRAERRHRAAAEHDLFRAVRSARARHAGGPR